MHACMHDVLSHVYANKATTACTPGGITGVEYLIFELTTSYYTSRSSLMRRSTSSWPSQSPEILPIQYVLSACRTRSMHWPIDPCLGSLERPCRCNTLLRIPAAPNSFFIYDDCRAADCELEQRRWACMHACTTFLATCTPTRRPLRALLVA